MLPTLLEPCAAALDRLRAAIRQPSWRSALPYFLLVDPDCGAAETQAAAAGAAAALDELPCAAAFYGDDALSNHLYMSRWSDPPHLARDQALLRDTPQLEYLFLFHKDGRLREAALDKMNGPARSAFLVCALAWRLNDWAEPVRAAAARCVARVTPGAQPDILAEAAAVLLLRMGNWARWGGNAAILETALARPDVADSLARRLLTARNGRAGAILRQALRWEGLDRHLPELARDARLPGVRGVALQALLERKATWPTGWTWEWVNKAYGLGKRVPVTQCRTLADAPEALALIEAAASDRSALVRKIASQALVERRFDGDEVGRLAARFAADRNRRVREPAEFVLRKRAEAGAAAQRPAPGA